MSRYTWLLDNSCGGVINGVPQTKNHRSTWSEDRVLYEGIFTRSVVNILAELLEEKGIEYVKLVPQCQDIGTYERIMRVAAWQRESNAVLVSIHTNSGNGTGVNVLSCAGSHAVARSFKTCLATDFDGETVRHIDVTENDDDSRADIAKMLKKAQCPSIATQCFYMDNEAECKEILMSRLMRQGVAKAHLEAILLCEEFGF